LTNYKHYSET